MQNLATVLRDRVREHFGEEAVEAGRFAADLTAWHQSWRPLPTEEPG